ncbi:MAG TPA: lytic transglycosylase domain-containing protein [Alphaproteobacteria bacterium]|nr:lytic transglycosylase domain-containing protein [Alphaproteobacteria bacterium]
MRAGLLAFGAMLGILAAGAAAADSSGLSTEDREIYKAAFHAADVNRWTDAKSLASQAKDPILAKVITWLYVIRPTSDANFDEIAGFCEDNPDWPKPELLRERGEAALPDDMAQSRVRAYFERNTPVSATGKVRYAEALMATDEEKAGADLLRKAWIEGNFGERQEQLVLEKHRDLIRSADNNARLDRLLWDGQTHAARALMRHVDSAHAALADARLRLQGMELGVERAISRVPGDLQGNPGLLFDRLRWRQHKDMDDEAAAILFHPPADLVRPELWWQARAVQVHRALGQGRVREALRLAENHGQKPGTTNYADAEWLAGWIELRLLHEPKQALKHFDAVADAVRYPISRARAEYWQGRAQEDLGKSKEASDSFAAAANFSATYYGQVAALRIDASARFVLPPSPKPAVFQREVFESKELVRVVRALGQVGEEDLKEVFIKRLGGLATTPEEAVLVADLAVSEMRPDLAVRLARQTWHGEVPLTVHSYPTRTLPPTVSTEGALVLAVIRQESAFDPRAVSRAGALGLMQLMPATARKTASGLGLRYASNRLTDDPDYNVQVGSAYLTQLLDDFGGSYALALAAYNAGPARVREWMRDNGDPRSPQVDMIDWIEMIPFDETRNYVQRVLEALNIYREQIGGVRVGLDGENSGQNGASEP